MKEALDRHETDEDDEYHDSFADVEDLTDTQNNERTSQSSNQETTMSIATDHETNEDDEYHDSLADIEDLIDTLNDKKVIKDPIC